MAPLRAEVIAIGDELTTGQRVDTNTQWLSERLTEAGAQVLYHTTVGDTLADNIAAFRVAAERTDVVVLTGGLGPTADDLTRDAMAAAAGIELLEDPASLAHLASIFRSRGREMPPQNARQAQFPAGATPITNNGGTAPGVDFTIGRCRFFALPGVPAEMRAMWAESVAPAVVAMSPAQRVTRHWLVRCFGVGESSLEAMLPEMIAREREPLVGITASKATITLRVTASGTDETACWRAMRPTLDEARSVLGPIVFAEQPGGQDDLDLHHAVAEALDTRGLTVSTVETMTRGLLARWLADAETWTHVPDGGDLNASLVREARYVPAESAPPPGEAAAALAGEAGCAIAIGVERPGADVAGNVVPIAVATPAGVVTKEIILVGHASIHQPLVAKHALNLLRLELLK